MAETSLWVVEKDGQVLSRGFQSEAAARQYVEHFVNGLERHTKGSKVRVPDFNVKLDRQYLKDDDQLWNEYKTHTQVRM